MDDRDRDIHLGQSRVPATHLCIHVGL
jgi:hypothetical protein